MSATKSPTLQRLQLPHLQQRALASSLPGLVHAMAVPDIASEDVQAVPVAASEDVLAVPEIASEDAQAAPVTASEDVRAVPEIASEDVQAAPGMVRASEEQEPVTEEHWPRVPSPCGRSLVASMAAV